MRIHSMDAILFSRFDMVLKFWKDEAFTCVITKLEHVRVDLTRGHANGVT